MNRLKQLNQRFTDWEMEHPWLDSMLYGCILGITYGIVWYFSGHSLSDCVIIALLVGILSILLRRFYSWPMLQRRRQNPPSRQHRAWEMALVAGVLSMLAIWNLVLIFGYDASFTMIIAPSLLVGLVVALLVYRWRVRS